MGSRLATVTQDGDGDGDGAGDTSLEMSACHTAAGCWALPRRDGGLGWMEGAHKHAAWALVPCPAVEGGKVGKGVRDNDSRDMSVCAGMRTRMGMGTGLPGPQWEFGGDPCGHRGGEWGRRVWASAGTRATGCRLRCQTEVRAARRDRDSLRTPTSGCHGVGSPAGLGDTQAKGRGCP